MVKKITDHTGFVKGIVWDPVGQYLATQSDDKSVRIWRTTDWGLEKSITEPFVDSPTASFSMRLGCVRSVASLSLADPEQMVTRRHAHHHA